MYLVYQQFIITITQYFDDQKHNICARNYTWN
jgi:hypothetical protein